MSMYHPKRQRPINVVLAGGSRVGLAVPEAPRRDPILRVRRLAGEQKHAVE